MAVKKSVNIAEAAETEQKNAAVAERPDPGTDKTGTGQEIAPAQKEKEEPVTLVYIGPSLPAGQLKSNRIFIGTMEEIEKELGTILEKYPLVRKMLVPADQVAEKKDRIRTAGNILNKYYSDIVSSAAANEAKEG